MEFKIVDKINEADKSEIYQGLLEFNWRYSWKLAYCQVSLGETEL